MNWREFFNLIIDELYNRELKMLNLYYISTA